MKNRVITCLAALAVAGSVSAQILDADQISDRLMRDALAFGLANGISFNEPAVAALLSGVQQASVDIAMRPEIYPDAQRRLNEVVLELGRQAGQTESGSAGVLLPPSGGDSVAGDPSEDADRSPADADTSPDSPASIVVSDRDVFVFLASFCPLWPVCD